MKQMLVTALLVAIVSFSLSACQRQMGGMGEMRHMSGREMARAMHDPATMEEWMGEMMGSPELMGRMMERMHERLRERARAGEHVPVYCPLMGFGAERLPAPETPYEPGSLSATELFARKCSRCHALPDPSRHTPAEWVDTLERMKRHMDAVDFVELRPGELEAIRAYLQEEASG